MVKRRDFMPLCMHLLCCMVINCRVPEAANISDDLKRELSDDSKLAISKDPRMAMNTVVSRHNLAFGKDNILKSGVDKNEYVVWVDSIKNYLADSLNDSKNIIFNENDILKSYIDTLHDYYVKVYINKQLTDNLELIIMTIKKSEDYLMRISSSLENLKKVKSFKDQRSDTVNEFLLATFEKLQKDIKKFVAELQGKIGIRGYDQENIFVKTFSDKGFSDRAEFIEKKLKLSKNKEAQEKVKKTLLEQNKSLQELLKVLKENFNSYFSGGIISFSGINQDKIDMLKMHRDSARNALKNLNNIKSLINSELQDTYAYLEDMYKRIEKDSDRLLIVLRTAS